jgi:hypothetical protein
MFDAAAAELVSDIVTRFGPLPGSGGQNLRKMPSFCPSLHLVSPDRSASSSPALAPDA